MPCCHPLSLPLDVWCKWHCYVLVLATPVRAAVYLAFYGEMVKQYPQYYRFDVGCVGISARSCLLVRSVLQVYSTHQVLVIRRISCYMYQQ